MKLTQADWQFLKGIQEAPKKIKKGHPNINESEIPIVAELKLSGLTIAEVSKKTGYSTGQIRVIVAKYLEQNPAIAKDYVQRVIKHGAEHSRRETAAAFGISKSLAHQIISGESPAYMEYMP